MSHTTLISVISLAAHVSDPHWIVFDCRHNLADPDAGYRAYQAGHIPGARFLHLDRDLSGPKTGMNGRHPLPDPARFAARLAELGMNRSMQVVAYDDAGGAFAARLWWMLKWLGHERVALLDGGLPQWTGEGHPVTHALPVFKPGDFSAAPVMTEVTADELSRDLPHGRWLIVDARTPERFQGVGETLDPVGGHIPGALNRFFRENLDGEGRFKSPEELRRAIHALIGDRDPATVVHQCGSGVTACHNLLAMELAGLRGSKLYAGSWSEWCADPGRPRARD